MASQPEILFLHGALGVGEDLESLMEFMRGHGFRTKYFTFSGHGPNGQMAVDFRIDHFAKEMDDFMQKNNMKDVIVFGYSMGGYVALYHKANMENSPISSIITYGTKFNWSEAAVAKELPLLNPEHLMEKYPQMAEKLAAKHGERWKHILRSTAHMMQNLEKLDGLTKEDLHDFDIPVCLVLGDQDRMVTMEETHLASSWIPHSQVKTVPHSKHELERTNIKELSQVLLEFIEG